MGLLVQWVQPVDEEVDGRLAGQFLVVGGDEARGGDSAEVHQIQQVRFRLTSNI